MTPTEIAEWAARCAARKTDGFMVSPGEPTQIIAAALRLYAEQQTKTKRPPPSRRSAAARRTASSATNSPDALRQPKRVPCRSIAATRRLVEHMRVFFDFGGDPPDATGVEVQDIEGAEAAAITGLAAIANDRAWQHPTLLSVRIRGEDGGVLSVASLRASIVRIAY